MWWLWLVTGLWVGTVFGLFLGAVVSKGHAEADAAEREQARPAAPPRPDGEVG